MLIGPGGVLALVVGAWGVLWALKVAPGRSWGALLPGLVAFAALLVAFPLLTAAGEGVLGFALATRAAPHDRDLLRAEALGVIIRPLAATVSSFGVIVVATLLARLRAPPQSGDVGFRLFDLAAGAVVLVTSLVGVIDLLLLRGTVGRATAAGSAWLPRASSSALVAVACAGVLLGIAGLLALIRGLGPYLRRRRSQSW